MTVSSTASPVTPEAINRVVKLTAPTRASGGKKDCKFCKPAGYKFLPLRYAVICGVDATQASMWPELTYPLGAGVVEQKLARSRYTVRMLREGFLYVLVSRTSGAMDWQGYAVTAGGMLASFPVGKPPVTPPVFTCDLSTEGVGASMVSIERIEEVKSIHVLFTPDVLPVEMLEKREKDKLGMQSMPKVWKGQPHALDAHALKQWVAEFKLNTDGMSAVSSTDPKLTARAPLARQLFPLMGGPGEDKPLFDEHGKRLSALVKQLEELKSCGFVLWDAIGITQELNQWHRHISDEINGHRAKKHSQRIRRLDWIKQRFARQSRHATAAYRRFAEARLSTELSHAYRCRQRPARTAGIERLHVAEPNVYRTGSHGSAEHRQPATASTSRPGSRETRRHAAA